MKTIRLYVFSALALLASDARAGKQFLGSIPVQYTTAGKEIVLDMHRFWQPADDKNLEFTTKDDVDLAFDSAAFQLRARPGKAGISEVELTASGDGAKLSTILTIAAEPGGTPQHHFVFKPDAVAAGVSASRKVFVAGAFNGWSTEKTPMTGPNGQGEYTADVPLPVGKNTYKFVVDGNWTVDPANPQTEDDGGGHKNSIVTISDTQKTMEPPVIYADKIDSKSISVSFDSKSPAARTIDSPSLSVRAVSKIDIARVSAVWETDSGSISISPIPIRIFHID